MPPIIGHRSDDNSNNSIKLILIESLARMKEECDVEMNIWKNGAIVLLRMGEWYKIIVLTTLKLILLVDVFDQDFTLLGWSYTTSTLTIKSSMARTDKEIDVHLKTSSLLWMFEVESLFGVAL